ncbi:MAG: OsmC family protein [Bacteroidia bacterium]|nr:OsmC family protein [Bacteroidia bacterium]MBP9688803.1 OsmC family protein [Bacteroidia bacterium]
MHTSEVIYLGDLRTKSTHVASGEQVITDAPIDNNGKGEAFSPTDMMATSLAQCMLTIMGIEANKLGIDIAGTKTLVTKKMNLSPRKVAIIEIVYTIPKSVIDYKSELEQAALSCPVALSLHPDVKQKITFNYD